MKKKFSLTSFMRPMGTICRTILHLFASMRNWNLLFVILSLFFSPLAAEIAYDVKYEGFNDREILDVLHSVSQLYLLRDQPPATKTALARRAEADIHNMDMGLQSLGFYDPKITMQIDDQSEPTMVTLFIETGPLFRLESVEIVPARAWNSQKEEISDLIDTCENVPKDKFPYSTIDPTMLGFILGEPIYPQIILDAEFRLLEILARRGYPLAVLSKREVIADQEAATIRIIFYLDSGPKAFFGPITIRGLCSVREPVVLKKIRWNEGDPYHPFLVERTLTEIENSGLFNSVAIYPADSLNEEGRLPMYIELIEGKHHTIGLGVSYNTQLGPGILAEWEHRNVRQRGEKLTLRTDLWWIKQNGYVRFAQPDFISPGQDLVWIGEAEREVTKGFTESFISFSSLIDRTINDYTKLSYGVSFKQLHTGDTEHDNGLSSLIKTPIHYRWFYADDLLNPTHGASLNYKFIPTYELIKDHALYFIQTLTATHYFPLTKDRSYVFANKIILGSIGGTTRSEIPTPERFFAGSETTLRGYRYQTVSPLNAEGDPIGGRSLMIYTAEFRARVNETFGWVIFYDVGNVYEQVLPQFNHKQLNSVGFGLRYGTLVGPLRLDIAFPLNPRKGLDRKFELYLSIGQAF